MNIQQNMPDWLIQFKNEQEKLLQISALVKQKPERWKYADLASLEHDFQIPTTTDNQSFIQNTSINAIIKNKSIPNTIKIVFLNGQFYSELSDLDLLPKEILIKSFDKAFKTNEELIKTFYKPIDAKKYPFAHLNVSRSNSGTLLYFPKNFQCDKNIHLLSINDLRNASLLPQRLIVVDENSHIKLIDEYISHDKYTLNTLSKITLKNHAQIEIIKIQNEAKNAKHLAYTFIEQHENSSLNLTNFGFGSVFARDEIITILSSPHARCETNGFYYLSNDQQYIDYHIDIHHKANNTKSDMFYKGILNKNTKAVFNGRLVVEKNTQKVDAHQTNHHLLLSKSAESYSKPELEIYARDVKCKHGATTGKLNDDALFYLRARGISYQTAVQILLYAYADEVITKINDDSIKTYLKEYIAHEINDKSH